eukprot:4140154-Pleurochrysis_carterae.AAC.1
MSALPRASAAPGRTAAFPPSLPAAPEPLASLSPTSSLIGAIRPPSGSTSFPAHSQQARAAEMARPRGIAMGTVQGGRGVVPPALNLGRGGRGTPSIFSHHQQGADAPTRKPRRRGKKRPKTLHPPGSESCRPMDQRFSPRAVTRIPKEMPGDLDRNCALGPTKALGRMHHRLRKEVGRIVLTLGRISVPGSFRGTLAALFSLARVALGFVAGGLRACASRG